MILIMVIIAPVFLFRGCGRNSQMDKMSDQEIRSYFKKHKKDLERIVEICKQNPEIDFMDDSVEGASFYNDNVYDFSKQTPKVQRAVKEAIQIIKRDKLFSVHCGHFYHLPDHPFTGVSFVLYSSGLTVAGEGQSIEYDSRWYREVYLRNHKIEQNLSKNKILTTDGWYYREFSD